MRILFVSTPVLSLFSIKPFAEPNIGGGMVAGALRHEGFETDYIDLNSKLMNYRSTNNFLDIASGKSNLSKEEFKTLTTVEGLNDYLTGKVVPDRIKFWADYLVNELIQLNLPEPDIFSVTMERRLQDYYLSYGTLNFMIILRKHLDDYLPKDIPFYVGGSYTLTILNDHNYLQHVVDNIVDDRLLPTVFFTGQGHKDFGEYIKNHLEDDKLGKHKGSVKKLGSNKKGISSFPALMPDNPRDGDLKPHLLFNKTIREQIPELENIKPFNFYNWKFSEGCIFKCSFCPSGIDPLFEKEELSYVIDSLQYFNDQGVEYIRFFNDNFNFKVKWVHEFCNEIVKRNIKIKWTDSANMRIGDKDMFAAMADAGCIKLWYGTETVSNRLLKIIRKEVKQDRILQVLEWANSVGIWNSCNFIYNFPTETDQEFDELLNFINTHFSSGLINAYQINPFQLYPNAEYAVNPGRFNVKLKELDIKSRRLKYDEIDGLCWEDILEREKRKTEKIRSEIKHGHTLLQNDYIFFSLNKVFGKNKKDMIKAMDILLNYKNRFFMNFTYTNGYNDNLYSNWFKELNKTNETYSLIAAKEDHMQTVSIDENQPVQC